MPNLIPADSFPDVPALEDGKGANGAYLNQPHQALANRTHNLNETIKASGLTRQGATRIREVQNQDDLKAITGMASGDLCLVMGLGIYRYFASPPNTIAIHPWQIKPNVGPGMWFHSLALAVRPNVEPVLNDNRRNMLVVHDNDGRIAADVPKNGIVALKATGGTPVEWFTGTTDKQSEHARIALGQLQKNDVIDVAGTIRANVTQGTVHAEMRIALLADGSEVAASLGDAVVGPVLTITAAQEKHYLPIAGRHVVKEAANCEVVLIGKLSGSSDWQLMTMGVSATVYRP